MNSYKDTLIHVKQRPGGLFILNKPVANFPEDKLSFQTLFESPLISMSDYNCRIERGGPQAEEHNQSNSIVLMRHGAFCKHFGSRNVTATVNQSVFFARDSAYRVGHPAGSKYPSAAKRSPSAVMNAPPRQWNQRHNYRERGLVSSVGVSRCVFLYSCYSCNSWLILKTI
jgi:hypothetical protein